MNFITRKYDVRVLTVKSQISRNYETQKHIVGNMKIKCRKFKPLGNVDVPPSYERALALTSVLLCSITTHDWKTGFAHKSVSRHLIVFQPGLHPNRSCLKYKENLHQAIACSPCFALS